MNAELRTEALTGPWEAHIADRYGHVILPDEIRDLHTDPDEMRVVIVRRSAVPSGPDADGERRLPGSYAPLDLLTEFGGFDYADEVECAWVQAEAMVAGLNAARS